MHSPIIRRLAIIAVVALLACLPVPASSSSQLSSLANTGWSLPLAKLTARRRNKSSFSSHDGIVDNGIVDKSYALNEDDFEEDDYSEYDHDGSGSDDESIHHYSDPIHFRGGAAASAAAAAGRSRVNLPGIHTGWRKQTNNNNNNRGNRGGKIRTKKQQHQQLQTLQNQKLRQFRKLFRQKQRQFQTQLYALNSRIDPYFPKPPYSLWQMDDKSPIGKTTLTGKIFLLNIVVFGLQTAYPRLTAMGAKRSDLLLDGRQLYRLLTPVFLHGGIGHLMANSYSLKSMGMNVESAFGRNRMLWTYLVSGVTGNVLSAIQSPNPAVGASGAIFGLVGAYYTFLSRNQDVFGRSGARQKGALIETIGINLLLGMTNPMIDNWGHIGGFIGGVGMAYLIGPKLHVARVPLGADNNLANGGYGAGRVMIDRPFLTFRAPEFVEDGLFRANDGLRNLGRRVERGVAGLINGGNGEREYFLDENVDFAVGGAAAGNGDGTIYRTLKEDDVQLDSSVNVSPSDGFRQDVSQLDPTVVRQQRMRRQQQLRQRSRSIPGAGRSLRPRYGHHYR